MISLTYEGDEIIDDVVIASASFESRSDGVAGVCSFRVRDTGHTYAPGYFKTGGELILEIDGERMWGGYVMTVGRAYAFDVDDTTVPADTPRFWAIEGADWNVLFSRRIVHDKTTPTNPVPSYPGSTADSDVVLDLVDDFLDLEDDGISTAGVEAVGPISPFGEEFWPGDPGETWGTVMNRIIASNNAIYYLDPDKTLQYRDAEVPSAPFDLSDRPSGGTFGFREMTVFSAATEMANDALVWGAGRGSDQVVFGRATDATSIATHGLFQWGDFRADMWLADTVQRRADSYVYGSPTSRRGHKDDRDTILFTTFRPGLRVGMVVDFTSEVFGYQDNVPVRRLMITFPTPTDAKYEYELSERYDTPFFFADPLPPPFPFDEWVTEDLGPREASPPATIQQFGSGLVNTSRLFRGTTEVNGALVWFIGWTTGPTGITAATADQQIFVQYSDAEGGSQRQLWMLVALDNPSPTGLEITFGVTAAITASWNIFGNATGSLNTYEVAWLPVDVGLPSISDSWGNWSGGPVLDPNAEEPPYPLSRIRHGEKPGTIFFRETLLTGVNQGPRSVYVPPQYTRAGQNWYIFRQSWVTYHGLFYGPGATGTVRLGTPPLAQVPSAALRPPSSWAHGDVYQTTHPYVPGTLSISIEGVELIRGVDFEETDPATGTFTLTGETQDWSGSLYVFYRRANMTPVYYNPDPPLGPGAPEPGEPYVDAGGVVGGRWYRPAGQRQLGWGTVYDGVNCNMTASAMALDRHTYGFHSATHGYPVSSPPAHRFYSGVTEVRGTSQAEAVKAWRVGWGETLLNTGTVGWSYFVKQIQSGRGAIVAGRYSAMAAPYKKQASFNGPHAIYINEQLADGSFWGFDPLYRYPIIYPYSVLYDYMVSFFGSQSQLVCSFTRVTPRI